MRVHLGSLAGLQEVHHQSRQMGSERKEASQTESHLVQVHHLAMCWLTPDSQKLDDEVNLLKPNCWWLLSKWSVGLAPTPIMFSPSLHQDQHSAMKATRSWKWVWNQQGLKLPPVISKQAEQKRSESFAYTIEIAPPTILAWNLKHIVMTTWTLESTGDQKTNGTSKNIMQEQKCWEN